MKLAAALLTLGLATLGAHAQPVYRCGNEYSQTPCPQGRIVDATDPRTAAQRAEARRVAADERRLAADMRKDRLADQAALKPAAAAGSFSAAPATKLAPAAEHGKVKKKRDFARPSSPTDFVAVDPSSRPRRGRK